MNETSEYKVADLGLKDWGRKEIAVSEFEMPVIFLLHSGGFFSISVPGASGLNVSFT